MRDSNVGLNEPLFFFREAVRSWSVNCHDACVPMHGTMPETAFRQIKPGLVPK